MKIFNQSNYSIPKELEDYLNQIYLIFIDYTNTNKDLSVEVGLLSEEKIKELNREYRGKDEVTDVLSFPLEPIDSEKLLGSIYFSPSIISKKYENYLFGFCYLFAHSLLHLIGYDHGTEMFDLQENIVSKVFK